MVTKIQNTLGVILETAESLGAVPDKRRNISKLKLWALISFQ